MKKLKKLVLKKEVVARISDNEMDRLLGRGNFCPYGNPLRVCSYLNTCNDCPDSGAGDCPNYSQAGTGCDAETCGWAYTCNGLI